MTILQKYRNDLSEGVIANASRVDEVRLLLWSCGKQSKVEMTIGEAMDIIEKLEAAVQSVLEGKKPAVEMTGPGWEIDP